MKKLIFILATLISFGAIAAEACYVAVSIDINEKTVNYKFTNQNYSDLIDLLKLDRNCGGAVWDILSSANENPTSIMFNEIEMPMVFIYKYEKDDIYKPLIASTAADKGFVIIKTKDPMVVKIVDKKFAAQIKR